MEFGFWISLFLILYTYILYAVFIKLYLLFFPRKKIKPQNLFPSVSVVVACYNELSFIEKKIINLLELDYDEKKLSFVFITDGSDDDSQKIVEKYIALYPNRIKLFHKNERKGKQHAINRVWSLINSEIVVFNDCNTIVNKEAINEIVKHFNDSKVGVVNGEKKIIVDSTDDAVSSGEGLYWKYESILKSLDSDFYTSVGSAGELFAIRSALYEPVPAGISIEDFYLSMKIVLKGYRNVYEPRAFAKEYASFSLKDEFKRKRRISAGAFKTVVSLTEIFQIKHFKTLFLYVSHRVFRWIVAPVCLIVLLVLNLFLSAPIYKVFLILQIAFYMLAFIGYLFRNSKTRLQIIFIPFYFVFMNVALFTGFLDFLKNRNHTIWEKVNRRQIN